MIEYSSQIELPTVLIETESMQPTEVTDFTIDESGSPTSIPSQIDSFQLVSQHSMVNNPVEGLDMGEEEKELGGSAHKEQQDKASSELLESPEGSDYLDGSPSKKL